jgi:hypothetical protein
MTNWVHMEYVNVYGKKVKHYCSVKGIKDIKKVMERYNIRAEDITEMIVDDRVTNIEKVRENLT